jgi:4-nitrophenyl phosphatase
MTVSGAVIDLDGTVYRGKDPLPGAPDAIEQFRERGLELLFLSNNPTKTRAAYVERLAGMDIEADESEVLSAGTVTTTYLREHHGDDDVFLVGSPGLEAQLAEADLSLVSDPEISDVLVASWDLDFHYDDMQDALWALDDETAFVGSDPDRTVPAGNGKITPGSGAIIRAIEGVTDREADIVLGKPSEPAIEMSSDALAAPLEECLLVGDRLDTDIAMGERAGMTTALVLTGASTRADIHTVDVTPDHVLDSIADVPGLLDGDLETAETGPERD